MSPAARRGKKPARLLLGLALLFVAGLVVAGAFGDVGGGFTTSSGSTDTTTASSQTATDTTPSSDSTTTDATPTTSDSSSTTTTPAPPPVYSPTISSDKADYWPGETVTLMGYGWQTGRAVHMLV